MRSPLVSIVSPCLNGVDYLVEAIASVQSQTMPDWEMLVVDDGSTDGSDLVAAASAEADPRIIPMRTSGRTGAGAARNAGLGVARGRYVAFLDCDDWWLPTKLADQVSALESSGAAFCASPYWVCDADGHPVRLQTAEGPLTSQRYLLKRCVIGCLTVLADVERLGAFRFREHLRKAEDFVLWVELLRRCEQLAMPAVATTSPVACYRVHDSGQSRSKLAHARAHWHAYRNELNLSWPRAALYFGSYAVHGLLARAWHTATA